MVVVLLVWCAGWANEYEGKGMVFVVALGSNRIEGACFHSCKTQDHRGWEGYLLNPAPAVKAVI